MYTYMWRTEIDLGWLWGGGVSITYFVKQDLFPEARACRFGLSSWPVSPEDQFVSTPPPFSLCCGYGLAPASGQVLGTQT